MKKYNARVDVQKFLNLPGHHGGAFVRAYVEDTSERSVVTWRYDGSPYNFEPRLILEIADCSNKATLEFELTSSERRANAFHKIDSMIEALQEFRAGLVEESTLYKQRQRALDEYNDHIKTDQTRTTEAKAEAKAEEKKAEVLAFFEARKLYIDEEY